MVGTTSRWIAAWLLIGVFSAPMALAQQPLAEPTSPQISVEELDALVTTLEDEPARQKLIQQLRGLIEARRAQAGETPASAPNDYGATLLASLAEQVDHVATQFGEAVGIILDVPRIAAQVLQKAQEPANRQRWFEILSKLVFVVGAGFLGQLLVGRLLTHPRQFLQSREPIAVVPKIGFQAVRTLFDVAAIAAFAGAAYGALSLVDPRLVTRLVAITIINANILVRLVMLLARLLLAPDRADLRMLNVNDETAQYLVIWARRVAVFTIWAYFVAEAALLLGLPDGAHAAFTKTAGLFLAGILVVFVMQNRLAVAGRFYAETDAPAGGTFRGLGRLLAETWHIFAVLFIVAAYGVWALGVQGGFPFLVRAVATSLAVFFIARLAIAGLRAAVRRSFRLRDDLRKRFPSLEQRANRYMTVLQRFFEGVVYLVSGIVLLDAWGVQTFGWLASDAGRFVASRVATLIVILVGAAVVWEVVSAIIERYLEERESGGNTVARSARVRTLLPLMRNVVRITLGVVVTLTVLSELGINIGPLLAGAGVVGLAVGFGAQSLVKDVITGTFILLEDSIAVGNIVDLGGHVGIVEGLTIRSVRLRDLGGNVHVIPFGEVAALVNMTKGFSFALIDVGVAYRENVDEVIEILKEVAADMQLDDTYGPSILEPMEVLGLDSFGDSSVNIRVRIKTLPMKQWGIRREFHRRMKRVFDDKGIEIPFPHQTIYFGVDKLGQAPPARVVVTDEGRAEAVKEEADAV